MLSHLITPGQTTVGAQRPERRDRIRIRIRKRARRRQTIRVPHPVHHPSVIDDLWHRDAIRYCFDVERYVNSERAGLGDFAGLTTSHRPVRAVIDDPSDGR